MRLVKYTLFFAIFVSAWYQGWVKPTMYQANVRAEAERLRPVMAEACTEPNMPIQGDTGVFSATCHQIPGGVEIRFEHFPTDNGESPDAGGLFELESEEIRLYFF